jgi:hypothetical protein
VESSKSPKAVPDMSVKDILVNVAAEETMTENTDEERLTNGTVEELETGGTFERPLLDYTNKIQ